MDPGKQLTLPMGTVMQNIPQFHTRRKITNLPLCGYPSVCLQGGRALMVPNLEFPVNTHVQTLPASEENTHTTQFSTLLENITPC
jgi:hypothetical protein